MKTTFEKIKSFDPCEDGWKKLLDYYKPASLDEEIEFKDILKSNGVKDAVWALRVVEDKKRITLFCADVVESVLHLYEKRYPEDKRVRDCIKACRQYIDGRITKEELEVKRKAVKAAYYAAEAAAKAAAEVYAAYVAADVAYAANAAADAAAAANVAAAAAFYAIDAVARQQKWDEITDIFLKYF